MDIFRQPSDESSHGFTQSHKSDQESSSSEGSYSNRPTHSGEEEGVVLASSRPKKRAGRRIFKETRHPVYRGVRQRNKNKWVCELRVPNNNKTRIWLGTYPTAEMAARAHDVAALALRGKSACINFADSAWRLPLPASNDTDEIRRAAAEAAELFSDTAQQDQSLNNKVTDDEVCSSNVGVMEDAKPKQKEDMHVDEVAEVAQYDDDIQYHWVSRMADEPIRSPTPFLRDWSDCNIDSEFDAEVSLWSFSV